MRITRRGFLGVQSDGKRTLCSTRYDNFGSELSSTLFWNLEVIFAPLKRAINILLKELTRFPQITRFPLLKYKHLVHAVGLVFS